MALSAFDRLCIEVMAKDAIPDGAGVEAGIAFLSDPSKIKAGVLKAKEFTRNAILAMRQAGEPNPYRTATDEVICEAILKGIEERKAKRRPVGYPK